MQSTQEIREELTAFRAEVAALGGHEQLASDLDGVLGAPDEQLPQRCEMMKDSTLLGPFRPIKPGPGALLGMF